MSLHSVATWDGPPLVNGDSPQQGSAWGCLPRRPARFRSPPRSLMPPRQQNRRLFCVALFPPSKVGEPEAGAVGPGTPTGGAGATPPVAAALLDQSHGGHPGTDGETCGETGVCSIPTPHCPSTSSCRPWPCRPCRGTIVESTVSMAIRPAAVRRPKTGADTGGRRTTPGMLGPVGSPGSAAGSGPGPPRPHAHGY